MTGNAPKPAPPAKTANAPARAIMFQGTGSDVGKSLITAGLARALTNRGFKVMPFKPQNMSNNAAVTDDGGEIGRAQALQARACKCRPHTDMNPVLLKPQSQLGAQIVLQGKVYGNAKAAAYQAIKPKLLPAILESFQRLKAQADFVLVEGAGSASEVNLRRNDIANMGFARAADVPVVLIGDIDRGGVIASLVGTRHVIDPADAAMICGFLVNRFRGDPALFDDGMALIAKASNWRNFGLVPHFADAALLPAEDAFALGRQIAGKQRVQPGSTPTVPTAGTVPTAATMASQAVCQAPIRIAVPVLPHIANFDDLDPLAAEPGVEIVDIKPGTALPGDAALIILCGSKSTIADLAALRAAGFDIDIAAHQRRGGFVLGICGGLQMLGNRLADPLAIEGRRPVVDGLGLLDLETSLSNAKRLGAVHGTTIGDKAPLDGYLMHMGETTGAGLSRPFCKLDDGQFDGAIDQTGRVFGTYVHGLFANDAQRHAWLQRLGGTGAQVNYDNSVERVLDDLAAHLERHVDVDAIIASAR